MPLQDANPTPSFGGFGFSHSCVHVSTRRNKNPDGFCFASPDGGVREGFVVGVSRVNVSSLIHEYLDLVGVPPPDCRAQEWVTHLVADVDLSALGHELSHFFNCAGPDRSVKFRVSRRQRRALW